MNHESVQFKQNRKMMLLAMVAAPLMVWAGFSAWTDSDTTPYGRRRPAATSVAKFVCLPLGILLGFAGIRKLRDNRPALVLTPEGIEASETIRATRKIPWNRITSIELKPDGMLCLKIVEDANALRDGTLIRKGSDPVNLAMFGTPHNIALKAVAGNPTEIAQEVFRYWEKYSGFTIA
jgi:hypothetical protein